MFNFNAVVASFNLIAVDAGAYKDHKGFVLTYRPMFNNLAPQFGTHVASTSFIDAQDLFESLTSYYEVNLAPIVARSVVDFVARLSNVKEPDVEYTLVQLIDFVTKYEDKYSSNKFDEVRFYAQVRSDLKDEFARLGADTAPLSWVHAFADEGLHYRKDYNS